MIDENFILECASTLLNTKNISESNAIFGINDYWIRLWKEADINSKDCYKKILTDYALLVDINKTTELSKKYYKKISIEDISIIFKMPLKEILKFKAKEKKFYNMLMLQSKNVLQYQVAIILKKNGYVGRIL